MRQTRKAPIDPNHPKDKALHSIQLIDFKNHAETTIRLDDLTLLVSPNGSGKSGVLQGIHLASRPLHEPVRKVLTGTNDARLLTRRDLSRFQLKLSGGANPRSITPDEEEDRTRTLNLTINNPTKVGVVGSLSFMLDGETPVKKALVNEDSPAQRHQLANARAKIGVSLHLSLNADRLAKPSYLDSTEAGIDAQGYGLASAIAHLMTYEHERFEVLERDLIAIVPAVKRIRVRRVKVPKPSKSGNAQEETILADELVLDTRSGDQLPAAAISEGTLILLGLLTALSGHSSGRRLVLIDDIDQSLHPRAQTQLVALLRGIIDHSPGLQIVATSHSPYPTDEFVEDEVRVLSPREDGTAAAACPANHPDAERFRGALRTGELLSSVGDDWVVGQGATNAAAASR